MGRQISQSSEDRIGDKVRIRKGPQVGERGIIHTVTDDFIEVELSDRSRLKLSLHEITNYSRAARRAWEVMPKRAGRPHNHESPKKMVSLRIESDLWDKLGQAAEQGLIRSREQAINDLIREHLQTHHLIGS